MRIYGLRYNCIVNFLLLVELRTSGPLHTLSSLDVCTHCAMTWWLGAENSFRSFSRQELGGCEGKKGASQPSGSCQWVLDAISEELENL